MMFVFSRFGCLLNTISDGIFFVNHSISKFKKQITLLARAELETDSKVAKKDAECEVCAVA